MNAPVSNGLRFTRDIQFPRFSMKAGEVWSFSSRYPGPVQRAYEAAITGDMDRFRFAGGHCFVADVERV